MRNKHVLALACIALALCSAGPIGCAAQNAPSPNEDAAATQPTATESSTPETAEQNPSEAQPEQQPEQQAEEQASSGEALFNLEGTIEQTTMVDNDVLSVVAEELSYQNDRAVLKISVTNKTDSPLSVSACTFGFSANYVNDCMIEDGYLGCDLEAGQTAEEEISFDLMGLQLYGIHQIETIGLGLLAVDGESNNLYRGISEVKTSLAGTNSASTGSFQEAIDNPVVQQLVGFSVKPSTSNLKNIEMEGFDITSAVLTTNKDGETTLMLEIQNKTDEIISVGAKDVTIDGTLAYEGFWTADTLAAEKRAVMTFDLNGMIDLTSDVQQSDFDLEHISEIGMTLLATDDNGNTIAMPTEVAFSF